MNHEWEWRNDSAKCTILRDVPRPTHQFYWTVVSPIPHTDMNTTILVTTPFLTHKKEKGTVRWVLNGPCYVVVDSWHLCTTWCWTIILWPTIHTLIVPFKTRNTNINVVTFEKAYIFYLWLVRKIFTTC